MGPKFIWFIFCLALLASCGRKKEDAPPMRQDTTQEGMYSTTLHPVNPKLAPKISGKVLVSKYGDEFKVDVNLKNAPAGTHRQYIHSGRSCPTMNLDSNGDGYLDAEESSSSIGVGVVPLDGDLSGRDQGGSEFPQGNYNYSKSASYSLMLANIGIEIEELALEGRVVMIYGVPGNIALPASVTSKDNLLPHESVPIACGILKLTFDQPNESEWRTEEEVSRPSRPATRPRPRPRPKPENDNSRNGPQPWPDEWGPENGGRTDSNDGRPGSWWERVRNWWRCRFGRCNGQ